MSNEETTPVVDEEAEELAAALRLIKVRKMDPEAQAAAVAEEAEMAEAHASDRTAALEAFAAEWDTDNPAPETPITDTLVEFGLLKAAPKATDSDEGNGRSKMDEDHARAWLRQYKADKGAAKLAQKWPPLQAYRGQGHSANDPRFWAIKAEVEAE